MMKKFLGPILVLAAMVAFAFMAVGCNGTKSPTEPNVSNPWPVKVVVLDVVTGRGLKSALVSFSGTTADGFTLTTGVDGKTEAVTIYQPLAPTQLNLRVQSGGIVSGASYKDFTGSIGFTKSYDPREAKEVWVGTVYLTQA